MGMDQFHFIPPPTPGQPNHTPQINPRPTAQTHHLEPLGPQLFAHPAHLIQTKKHKTIPIGQLPGQLRSQDLGPANRQTMQQLANGGLIRLAAHAL
jgi:hypothetical protein